ncbi:C1 family peptidase [Chryseobacterium sp. Tr-659]|uniref:C1 family peptidase n=1 Tax=Chryseobacterium sp. Tr-659 TaxID=2608340 RepID=UPI00141DAE73|nr:C1 family peptidase [Chryseobacterium sp. Tr-659]NIF05192.1 C1 family peptidase [Chryseobacterium sp. Tr-659]
MKLKLTTLVLGVLFLSACKSNDDMDMEKPESTSQKYHSLGAKFVDEATYASFQKADVNALSLKFKNRNSENAQKALPANYSIAGAPIGDQGGEGSCVAWATAYAAASSLQHNFNGVAFPDAKRSPEYVFNQIKLSNDCQGSYISSALNLIKSQGVCSWDEMPYTDAGCTTQPSFLQTALAKNYKFTNWGVVNNTDLNGVKNLISMDLPVIIAVTVDSNFDNMGGLLGLGDWIWKSHGGTVRGGHAVTVIGYDDNKQAFKVQNSWGTGWGVNGYFWIDYNFFKKTKANNGAVNEAYVAYVD